jgi:hypothetical protein
MAQGPVVHLRSRLSHPISRVDGQGQTCWVLIALRGSDIEILAASWDEIVLGQETPRDTTSQRDLELLLLTKRILQMVC